MNNIGITDRRLLASIDVPQVLNVGLGTISSIIVARAEVAKRELLGLENGLPIQVARCIDVDIFDPILVLRELYSKNELDESEHSAEDVMQLFRLNPSEVIPLEVPEGGELIERMEQYGEFAYLKEYADEEVLSLLAEGSQAGARALRKLGCVITRWNVEKLIKPALKSALLRVKDNESVKEAISMGFRRVAQDQIKVYVFYSICGGCGAGAVVDVSYLVRQIASEENLRTRIIHIALLPGFVDQVNKDESLASAYAVLKEQNQMMSKHFDFPVKIGDGKLLKQRGKLADEVYLFEPVTELTSLTEASKFLGMIADFALVQQLSPVANKLRSVYNNIEKETLEISYAMQDAFGQIRYVGTGGVSRIFLPKESIFHYCQTRAARAALELYLGGKDEADD